MLNKNSRLHYVFIYHYFDIIKLNARFQKIKSYEKENF